MAGAGLLRALRTLRPRTLAATSGKFPAPVGCVIPPASCELPPPWGSAPVRTLQLRSALCAGHNKWSKVKNVKGPKDQARGSMFAKLGLLIRLAVREGGPNPEMNVNLAQILEQCRSKNMPKASIETAIKSASKPTSQYLVEVQGPGGSQLIIEVLTDNIPRSQHDVKVLLKSKGGALSEKAQRSFDRKGVLVVPGQNISMEQALELAIEVGAEDVQETEDEEEQPILQFICAATHMSRVQASLVKQGLQVTSSGLEFIPHTFVSLDQEQMEAASKLIGALNDWPDAFRVWDNITAHS